MIAPDPRQARQLPRRPASRRPFTTLAGSTVVAATLLFPAITDQSAAQEPSGEVTFTLVERPVAIAGKIEDYKQIYRTGKLSCFNGVTRLPEDHVFDIGSDGAFAIEFDLLHPVLGSARLDLEGEYYSLFLQPGKNYRVAIDAGQLRFEGDSARPSNEIARYSAKVANDLAPEKARAASIHGGDQSTAEARAAYEEYAEERRSHLSGYAEQFPLSEAARRAIEIDIKFEAAHSLICYRQEFIDGRLKPRRSLPPGFLDSVYKQYPVNTEGALVSRRYIEYVANIVDVLEEPQDASVEARIAFYGSQGVFTAQELELIAGAYRGDRAVLTSKEFASFDTPESRSQDFALRKRYKMLSLLSQVQPFPPGLGRDVIVAQAVSRHYFTGEFIAPTAADWIQLEDLIQSEAVISALRRQAARERGAKSGSEESTEPGAADSSAKAVADLLAAAKGKVVYIDFWATWCAPCRLEIPDAKRLAREFEKDDVVFLNLCAQSRKEDWSKLIRQKELGGEHLLLTDAGYEQLAKLYSVNGFPTYVLIDRQGKVISKSAPRPSSGDEIISLIHSLLK